MNFGFEDVEKKYLKKINRLVKIIIKLVCLEKILRQDNTVNKKSRLTSEQGVKVQIMKYYRDVNNQKRILSHKRHIIGAGGS